MAVLGTLAQLVVGALAWTLAEYVLHRFDMHGRSTRGATAREHRTHHATLDVPALTAGTWVGAGLVALAFAIGGRPAVAVGWMAAYVGYELVHRRIHMRPAPGREARAVEPSRYRRWVTAQHMHHHLTHAGANFGVTSPLWDVVFRTYRRPRAGEHAAAGPAGTGAGKARAPRRTRG